MDTIRKFFEDLTKDKIIDGYEELKISVEIGEFAILGYAKLIVSNPLFWIGLTIIAVTIITTILKRRR